MSLDVQSRVQSSAQQSVFSKITDAAGSAAISLFGMEDLGASPLEHLGKDKRISSNHSFGIHSYTKDIRGLHKQASRDLLKDMGMNTKTQDLSLIKAENFYRSTKTQFIHQLWISVQKLSPATKESLGLTLLIKDIQTALSTLSELNYKLYDAQVNGAEYTELIGRSSGVLTEGTIDNALIKLQTAELSAEIERVEKLVEDRLKEIILILKNHPIASIAKENPDCRILTSLCNFANRVHAILEFHPSTSEQSRINPVPFNVFRDFIALQGILHKIKTDSGFREQIINLEVDKLAFKGTARYRYDALGQTGRTLACASVTTEHTVFNFSSRNMVANGAFYSSVMLGLSESDYAAYNKSSQSGKEYTEGDTSSAGTYQRQMYQEAIKLARKTGDNDRADKLQNMYNHIFGDLKSKADGKGKKGFAHHMQQEYSKNMQAAKQNLSTYLLKQIKILYDLKTSQGDNLIGIDEDMLPWKEVFAFFDELRLAEQEEPAPQKVKDTFEYRLDNSKNIVTNMETCLTNAHASLQAKLAVQEEEQEPQLIITLKNSINTYPHDQFKVELAIRKLQEKIKELTQNIAPLELGDNPVEITPYKEFLTLLINIKNIRKQIARLADIKAELLAYKTDEGILPLHNYIKKTEPKIYAFFQENKELLKLSPDDFTTLDDLWVSFQMDFTQTQIELKKPKADRGLLAMGIKLIEGEKGLADVHKKVEEVTAELDEAAKSLKKTLIEDPKIQEIRDELHRSGIFSWFLNFSEFEVSAADFGSKVQHVKQAFWAAKKDTDLMLQKFFTDPKYLSLRKCLVIKYKNEDEVEIIKSLQELIEEFNLGSNDAINVENIKNFLRVFKSNPNNKAEFEFAIDPTSELGMLDASAQSFIDEIDALRGLLTAHNSSYAAHKEKLTTSLEKIIEDFAGLVLNTAQVKDFRDKRNEYIALNKTIADLEKQLKAAQDADNKPLIINLTTAIHEKNLAKTAMRNNPKSYPKLLSNILESLKGLPSYEFDKLQNATKRDSLNLGAKDKVDNSVQAVDVLFFEVDTSHQLKSGFFELLRNKLLNFVDLEAVDTTTFAQNSKNKAKIDALVASVKAFLTKTETVLTAEVKSAKDITAKLNLMADRVDISSKRPAHEEGPLSKIRRAIEAIKTGSRELTQNAAQLAMTLEKNQIAEMRRRIVEGWISSPAVQQLLQKMLKHGTDTITEETIGTVTATVRRDRRAWSALLSPHLLQQVDPTYIDSFGNLYKSMLNIISIASGEDAFFLEEFATVDLQEPFKALLIKNCKIFEDNSFQTCCIDWSRLSTQLQTISDKTSHADSATDRQLLDSVIPIFQESKILLVALNLKLNKNILTQAEFKEITNQISLIYPKLEIIIQQLSEHDSIPQSIKILLPELIELLKIKNLELIDKLGQSQKTKQAGETFVEGILEMLVFVQTAKSGKAAVPKTGAELLREVFITRSTHKLDKLDKDVENLLTNLHTLTTEYHVKCDEVEWPQGISDDVAAELLSDKDDFLKIGNLDTEVSREATLHLFSGKIGTPIVLIDFLQRYNIVDDFIALQNTMSKLKTLKTLNDEQKAALRTQMEAFAQTIYKIRVAHYWQAADDAILRKFIIALFGEESANTFMAYFNSGHSAHLMDDLTRDRWTMKGAWKALLKWWYTSGDVVVVDNVDGSAIVKSYWVSFENLKIEIIETALLSKKERTTLLIANLTVAIEKLETYNSKQAVMLEFYISSQEFRTLNLSGLDDLYVQTCRRLYLKPGSKCLDTSIDDMNAFNEAYTHIKRRKISIADVDYSVTDLLLMKEAKKADILALVQSYHLSFEQIVALAFNRKVDVVIDDETFNFSLNPGENSIELKYGGLDINDSIDATIANIKSNRAALAEHNRLVTKATQNIAKLKLHLGLDVPSDAFVALEALTHSQLIQDPVELLINDLTIAQKTEALQAAVQKIVLREATTQIEIEGLLEDNQEFYFVGEDAIRRKLTLKAPGENHRVDISVTYSHTVLETSSTPDVQSILTAVQTTVAAHEEQLAAIADIRENPNTTLVPDSTLAEKHAQVLAQIESNKKAVQILTKLGIQGLPDIADFEFDTVNLFLNNDDYNALQDDVKQKQEIHQRSNELLEKLTAASVSILNCQLTLHASFEQIKTSLLHGDKYTCDSSDLLGMIESGSTVQLTFESKDVQNRHRLRLDIKEDSLDFIMTIAGQSIQSHLDPSDLRNLGNNSLLSVGEIATKVMVVHKPLEALKALTSEVAAALALKISVHSGSDVLDAASLKAEILQQASSKATITKILGLEDFALNSVSTLQFNVGILTLTIKVYGKEITLQLDESLKLTANRTLLKNFIDKISAAKTAFLKSVNLGAQVLAAQTACGTEILTPDEIATLMPTQIMVNATGDFQRVVNNAGETQVDALTSFVNGLNPLVKGQRKGISIHDEAGNVIAGVSFEKTNSGSRCSSSSVTYRVFGKIAPPVKAQIETNLNACGISSTESANTSENVRAKGNQPLNTFTPTEIIAQLILEATKHLDKKADGTLAYKLYTQVIASDTPPDTDYERFMRVLPRILAPTPTPTSTSTSTPIVVINLDAEKRAKKEFEAAKEENKNAQAATAQSAKTYRASLSMPGSGAYTSPGVTEDDIAKRRVRAATRLDSAQKLVQKFTEQRAKIGSLAAPLTQSDTITEVEESNILSLLNGTVKKTLHLNTNTYASTRDTIGGKRSSFNSYISSTSNSNYENKEKVLKEMVLLGLQ